jgi:pyruvate dehydrogenase E2 component (dihydrolipoamide acetyltransferase)
MARFEFIMPDIGEGLADVEVAEWLVKIGDTVEENQPIAEVETDKAFVTMPAPATGKIVAFAAQEGERVKVGELLLVMETAPPSSSPLQGGEQRGAHPAPVTEVSEDGEQRATPARQVQASPIARKRARELGVVIEEVVGTGPRGRITIEDVERHAQQSGGAGEQSIEDRGSRIEDRGSRGAIFDLPSSILDPLHPSTPAPVHPGTPAQVERVPVRGLRRRIAEAMTHSVRTIPHVTGFYELDADALVKERAYLQRHAEAAGIRLGYMPFIIKATVEALKTNPSLNASFDEEENVILLKKVYHIGIAVASDEGLVVPVLHNADKLDLFEIAREADRIVTAAMERRLTPQDMQGGTFTVSNVGPAGGWFGTSIIKYPEAAIIGVGKIEERAVVRAGQIVARPILPISLSFDHRVLDGKEALAFIQTLRYYLEEDPRSLSPR